MELYETIEETAIRELKEETGICADELQLVAVLSGKDLKPCSSSVFKRIAVDRTFHCNVMVG